MSERRDSFAALRYEDYHAIALLRSVIGFQMQSVAIGWKLYERTSSAFVLGLIRFVQVLPVIVLILPAGHLKQSLAFKLESCISELTLELHRFRKT